VKNRVDHVITHVSITDVSLQTGTAGAVRPPTGSLTLCFRRCTHSTPRVHVQCHPSPRVGRISAAGVVRKLPRYSGDRGLRWNEHYYTNSSRHAPLATSVWQRITHEIAAMPFGCIRGKFCSVEKLHCRSRTAGGRADPFGRCQAALSTRNGDLILPST